MPFESLLKQVPQMAKNAFGATMNASKQGAARYPRLVTGAKWTLGTLLGARLLAGPFYGEHHYEDKSRAFPEGMSDEAKREALRTKPAPGTDVHATPEGTNTNLYGIAPITTRFNPKEGTVANTTRFPHPLHNFLGGPPGRVDRRIEGTNIVSEGSGAGFFPHVQQVTGPLMFRNLAHQTRLKHDPEYRKHYEAVQARRQESIFNAGLAQGD